MRRIAATVFVGVLGVMPGCATLIGLGDLPGPIPFDASAPDAGADQALDQTTPDVSVPDAADASDATDAPTCDANTATDLLNCGTCGHACVVPDGGTGATCMAGKCGYSASATDPSVKLWSNNSAWPRFLAIWADGVVYAGSVNISTSGVATNYLVPSNYEQDRRNSIWISNTKSKYLFSHKQGSTGWDEQGNAVVAGNVGGCCDYGMERPVAIDPVNGVGWLNGYTFSLTTGASQSNGVGAGFNAVSDKVDYDYGDMVGSNATDFVALYDRVQSKVQWNKNLGTGALAQAALASDDSLIVSSVQGSLYRIKLDGSNVWGPKTFKGVGTTVTMPNAILTGQGTILVNTGDPAVSAYDLATGNLLWSTPLAGYAFDMLVSDDGVAYAYLPTVPQVVGLDVTTGQLRYTFTQVPAANANVTADLLLRDGTFYANGNGNVLAWRAPSKSYDKLSPWPVRFHDNQRTCNRTAPLDY